MGKRYIDVNRLLTDVFDGGNLSKTEKERFKKEIERAIGEYINYDLCDRCGKKTFKTAVFDGHVTMRRYTKKTKLDCVKTEKGDIDGRSRYVPRTLILCKDCEKSLNEWFNMGSMLKGDNESFFVDNNDGFPEGF